MERNPHGRARNDLQHWGQIACGVICMAMVANLHYGWSAFVTPIDAKYQWGRSEIQFAFTIFVLAETWLMPLAGYLTDRYGARPVAMNGGVLTGISWSLNAYADSLEALYACAAIGGAGTGAVYGACIGSALKLFVERRGLAVGLTAAGFGTASAATILPIHTAIQAYGYESAFLYFGVGQAVVVALAAAGLKQQPEKLNPRMDTPPLPSVRDCGPLQIVVEPAFWVMYLTFFVVAAAGIMAISQLAPIAKEFGIANEPASILDLTLPALLFALNIDRVFSGLTRPFFGWVSDRAGREQAMAMAFAIESMAIVALACWGQDPLRFVLIAAVIFFGWGEIYSLFPAACADLFGTRFAATHAAMLYTAKGAAALFVLLLSGWVPPDVDWRAVIFCAAAMNIAALLLALLVLKPLRARRLAATRAQATGF